MCQPMSASPGLCLYICLHIFKSKSDVSNVTITIFYKAIRYILFLLR